MKTAMKSSIGKPTRGPTPNIDIGKEGGHWVRRGGFYTPRTGNSNGVRKTKRQKKNLSIKYEPPVVQPRWARKYAAA